MYTFGVPILINLGPFACVSSGKLVFRLSLATEWFSPCWRSLQSNGSGREVTVSREAGLSFGRLAQQLGDIRRLWRQW